MRMLEVLKKALSRWHKQRRARALGLNSPSFNKEKKFLDSENHDESIIKLIYFERHFILASLQNKI